ncbi:hypothetical protein DESA109040_12165 [Deinococcus saxicola]|uniref:ATP-dependent metallopeptidase FtsH/Yme1/Tma family protein n=1 Tax=Deinococcus saxicola TaxID=249406 RepID=UPI0039EFDD0A
MALLLAASLGLLWAQVRTPQRVTYAQFQALLESGQVSRVVVRGNAATVNLRRPAQPAAVSLRLPEGVTTSGSPESARFTAQITAHTGDYQTEPSGKWIGVLLILLPILLPIGLPAMCLALLLLWLIRRRARPDNLSER